MDKVNDALNNNISICSLRNANSVTSSANNKGIYSQIIKLSFIGLGLTILSFSYKKLFHQNLIYYLSMRLNHYSTYYKKSFRPSRIILIRHGESLGNIDKQIFNNTPDNKIPLTEKGKQQARDAANKILKLVNPNTKVKFFISPFYRTQQTFEEISTIFRANKIEYDHIEEPAIREQEWGNFQSDNKEEILEERNRVGRFYYRFKTGESGADVYDRSSHFLESLFRNMDNYQRGKYDTFIIVSHGLFIRLFLMRYFRLTVNQFEELYNLDNCEFISLKKNQNFSYEIEGCINNRYNIKHHYLND